MIWRQDFAEQGEFKPTLACRARRSTRAAGEYSRFHSFRSRNCVTMMWSLRKAITTDEFAEASAIVLHSLALDWSANEQILDCRLTTSEKQVVLTY